MRYLGFNSLHASMLTYIGVTIGAVIKFWAFAFVFLSGIFAWMLARDLKLSALASFVGGLIYTITPVLFDRLMGGAQDYLEGYMFLSLFLLLAYRAISADSAYRLIC